MPAQACNRQSLYCVPLYDSLGENAVEFTLNHSESSVVFVSAEKLPTLVAALPAVHGGLKTLVYWGSPRQEQLDAANKVCVRNKVISGGSLSLCCWPSCKAISGYRTTGMA